MKIAPLLIAILVATTTQAQIEKISFQASGLTCSMCSNAIYKAIKTLDFVEKVDVELKTYTYELTFKTQSTIDFDKIKRKVEGAGFSIISFIVMAELNDQSVKTDTRFVLGNNKIEWVGQEPKELKGVQRIRILDKGFVSGKEFKKNGFLVSDTGIYHASI